MALIVEVKVNSTPIFTIVAQRVTNTGGTPNDDDVSEYLITKVEYKTVWVRQYDYEREPVITELGRVTHRYGDGASILAQKALALIHV